MNVFLQYIDILFLVARCSFMMIFFFFESMKYLKCAHMGSKKYIISSDVRLIIMMSYDNCLTMFLKYFILLKKISP